MHWLDQLEQRSEKLLSYAFWKLWIGNNNHWLLFNLHLSEAKKAIYKEGVDNLDRFEREKDLET